MKTNIAVAILSSLFTIAAIKSSIWIGIMVWTGLCIFALIKLTNKTKEKTND